MISNLSWAFWIVLQSLLFAFGSILFPFFTIASSNHDHANSFKYVYQNVAENEMANEN